MKSSVIKNYFYNIGYQALLLVLPLVTTPYISRVLGAAGVGAFGYTNSITQYFVLFGCIGLNLYGQREIAYFQKSIDDRSRVFWELLTVRIVTVSISIFLFYFTACRSAKYGGLFVIQIIEIFASLVDVSWFFQGMEEFKKIVIRNALVKITGVLMIFLLVKDADDLWVYTGIYAVTLFLGNLSMWLYIPQYIKRINYKELHITKHIRPALLLFVPQIATNIYNLLDKSMIGFLTKSDVEVAYYEQAQKIMKMALSIPTALGTVMLPRVASLFSEGKEVKKYLYKSLRFVCMLTFPLCFGLCSIANGFVPWFFGDNYDKVADNLIILAPIIIIVGISNVIGVQYLLPVGRQKHYTYSVCIGTLVNLILNVLLISQLLSLGAAIASIIAELSVTVIQIIMVRKEFDIRLILKGIVKYIIASLIMFFILMLSKNWIDNNSLQGTVVQILIGIFSYMVLLLLMRDDLIFGIMRRGEK